MPIYRGFVVKVPTKRQDFDGKVTEDILYTSTPFPARDEDHARAVLIQKVIRSPYHTDDKGPATGGDDGDVIDFESPFIEVRIEKLSDSGSRPGYY